MLNLNAFESVASSVASVQILLVKALTAQQLKRGFVVQVNVVKRISDDFGHPHQTCLHILDEAQVNGSEQQATHA